MKMHRMFSHLAPLIPAAALLVGGGCAVPSSDEPEALGEATQAFNQYCTQTTPGTGADAEWTGGGSRSFTAAQYGSYCSGAVVVDVTHLAINYPTSSNAGVVINWEGSTPTTQAACEAATIEVDLFNWNGSAWVYNTYTPYVGHGVWYNFFGNYICSPPSVLFPTSTGALINGQNYRFEAAARTSWPSGSLVAISLTSVDGLH